MSNKEIVILSSSRKVGRKELHATVALVSMATVYSFPIEIPQLLV